MNPRFEKCPVMVPVIHPYLGKFYFEVFPDLLVDNPGGDGLYGEGAVLVPILRRHHHLTASHNPELQGHVHCEYPGRLALLYEIDGVPPG